LLFTTTTVAGLLLSCLIPGLVLANVVAVPINIIAAIAIVLTVVFIIVRPPVTPRGENAVRSFGRLCCLFCSLFSASKLDQAFIPMISSFGIFNTLPLGGGLGRGALFCLTLSFSVTTRQKLSKLCFALAVPSIDDAAKIERFIWLCNV